MRQPREPIARADCGILAIAHLEMYVADSEQAASFYGDLLALSRTQDGDRSAATLSAANVRLVLSTPPVDAGAVTERLERQGDSVKDVAFVVRDVNDAYHRAVSVGMRSIQEPRIDRRRGRATLTATVGACGDLVHSFVAPPDGSELRSGQVDESRPADRQLNPLGVDAIDHVAIALEKGSMDRLVEQYVTLGFEETHAEDVSTEYTSMRSRVVQTPNAEVRVVMLEPAEGKHASQIQEFIRRNQGPGVHHVALRSSNIVGTVSAITGKLNWLSTPAAYYERVEGRIGPVAELDELQKHGILVDRDADGMLLQVFAKPHGPVPTWFFEIIERRGAEGFGSGNIRALFEAVERTQQAGNWGKDARN